METRKFPFRDACSKSIYLNESIKIPLGFTAVYLPETKDCTGNAASYTGGYSVNGNQITLKEHIVLNKRIYEPDDWDNFRKVVFSQKKLAREKIILKKTGTEKNK